MVMLSKTRVLVVGLSLAAVGVAQAAPTVFAYNTANNSIISFDALTPGTLSSNVALTGLAAGESLIGIDYRPATGTLYGVAISATTSRVVIVNPTSGVVTGVGAGFTPLLATVPAYGIDFNPVPDRIRVMNSAGLSIRLNPNDGALAGTDTALAYVAGDPGAGAAPQVSQVAYTNNFGGTPNTTLFGIDFATDVLVRIGGVDGTPSPNTGALTTVGSLGVVTSTLAGGFDIETGTGTAFSVLRVGTVSNLYRVNLTTGAATLVGPVGGAANVNGITVAPTVTPITATPPTGSTIVLPEYVTTGPGSSSRTISFSITGAPGQLACVASGAGFTAAPNPLNLTLAGPNLVTVTYTGTAAGTFTGTLVCTPVSAAATGGPFTYSLRASVVLPTVPVPALGNISLMLLIAGFLGLGVVLVGRRQA